MANESDLNIFISWSGNLAKGITRVLHQWLPTMFDRVNPWFSDIDIDAGSRGLVAIQERLDVSSFGIIVVTPENFNKPWLVFESGALSRRLEGDLTKVVPVLVGFDDISQLAGSPLFQFQGVRLNEDGAKSLCLSIARTVEVSETTILTRFARSWPDLELEADAAIKAAGDQPPPPDIKEFDLIKGMYASMRNLERQIDNLASSVSHQSLGNLEAAPYIVESGVTPNRRFTGYIPPVDPWTDGDAMQAIQDEIKEYAEAAYRPVRYVSPMEWKGQKVVGVLFEDGQGMTSGTDDFNKFMKVAHRRWPVSVAIVSDRDLRDMRAT
jgi:hypothetical protein